MNDVTQINKETENNETLINSEIFSQSSTVINTEIIDNSSLVSGTILLDKYKITEKMNLSTGEANLYICEFENKKYVAKIYGREKAIKADVVSALERIQSKYVAKLVDFGEYNGKPIEIMQYFKNGSIQGKKYSFKELKEIIIPCINEGLNVLHGAGIIHKDLKPSNIMLNNDGKSVAIIDFGISSFESNGNTVIVTKTGMTPEYSAPETYRGLFLEESDYYSFGVTLYELFCGKSPYNGLNAEEIAQYTSIQKIPIPYDMPQELQELISALTYYDITNRKDKHNPNRRWTYEDVKNWCNGKKQAIPGEGTALNSIKIPAYKFMGKEYISMTELVRALTTFWKDGKKQLFRGLLSGFFKNFDPEITGYCMDAEESAVKNEDSDDIIYFRLLYKLVPDMVSFNWNGRVYESISALGRNVLEYLDKGNNCDYYIDVLENKVLSEYLKCIGVDNNSQITAIKALENNYQLNKKDSRNKQICLYLMGYLLSGQKKLQLGDKEFSNITDLVSHLKLLLNDSYDSFEKFCNQLIDSNNELDVKFESWLIALEKRKEVEKWKEKFAN